MQSTAAKNTIRLEAAKARLVGTTIATARKGYTGGGYATGFTNTTGQIIFSTVAKAGIYNIFIRFSTPSGEKGYELAVNGSRSSGMFPRTGDTFAVHDGGKVELITGTNTIVIEKGWGYYDIDSLELVPASVSPVPRKPPVATADPRATARTRALKRLMVSRYGTQTLSGQYEQSEIEYVRQVTGKTPAIFGGDLIDYSPSRIAFGADAKNTSENLIAAARDGFLVTLSWHWNAPTDLINKKYQGTDGKTVDGDWYFGFYTKATTFDLATVLRDPRGEKYALLLRDIDAIAVQLKKFAQADVPVLWRPLHEADGGWFWWGAKGAAAYVALWRLLYERLTVHHGLHNLLWVYSASSATRADWYPGDAFVDIVGIDSYPADTRDPLSGDWEALRRRFDGKKLLALTEFGGAPDVERMFRYGVRWSFFVSWSGDVGPKKNTKENLQQIYRSKEVGNRGAV